MMTSAVSGPPPQRRQPQNFWVCKFVQVFWRKPSASPWAQVFGK